MKQSSKSLLETATRSIEGRRGLELAFSILAESMVKLAKLRESVNSVLHWEEDSAELERIKVRNDYKRHGNSPVRSVLEAEICR